MELSLRVIIGMLVPFAIFIGYVWYQRILRHRVNSRVPVKEKMLRPPGEYLRLKIEDLDADLFV